MSSLGRPSARREDRVRFWQAIAEGAPTEDAAAAAGVCETVASDGFARLAGCHR
jgi:hypothetical protein